MGLNKPLLAVLLASAILTSQLCHTEELSSQSQQLLDNLSTEELQSLLQLLNEPEPGSKDLDKFDPQTLLQLGELLFDDDASHDNASLTITTTPTPTLTTTTTTPAPTTTTTTTPTPTTTTTKTPEAQINRREDLSSSPSRPSNEDLIQQLALFNSLLTSLSNNESTTTTKPDEPPAINEQQRALLTALFGALPQQTTESTFLKRATSENPVKGNQTPSPSDPNIAALSELLTQIAKAPVDSTGNLDMKGITASLSSQNQDHLKNFQTTNANMDAAATSQLSSLLTLLGTLGSLSNPAGTQASSLFNFGGTQSQGALQPNFLSGLFQQPQSQAAQSPNIFGNLFQPQPQANQGGSFGLGSVIGPGIGSVLSTMSNILGAGAGQPRVRGKGVDTRLGLGYRFGDAADAQIMWDIGPQIFTDPLQNEVRHPLTKKKRQDSSASNHIPETQLIQAEAQLEKEKQKVAAARRYMQVQQQQTLNRRMNYYANQPTTTRPYSPVTNLTPYAQEEAIKELWRMMEMKKQMEAQKRMQELHFMTQASQLSPLGFKPADLYEMQRNKHLFKRASTPTAENGVNLNSNNLGPTAPTVHKYPIPMPTSAYFPKFRPMPITPQTPYMQPAISKRSGFMQQPQGRRPGPAPAPPGLFNMNIFGRFRGQPSNSKVNNVPNRNTPRPDVGGMMGSPSQMGRWDLVDNHRFDNFKNTNGELDMTDTRDRFYLRNDQRRMVVEGAKKR